MPVVAECVGFAHFRCLMYVLRVIEVRCLLDAFNVFVRLNCSRQQFSISLGRRYGAECEGNVMSRQMLADVAASLESE